MYSKNHLRLPDYLKTSIASIGNQNYKEVKEILSKYNLNTVCDGARCPNKCECYSSKTATFLILGKTCTRNCAFCNISQKIPSYIDMNEPKNVALAIKDLGLKYCVITSVTRDDLVKNDDYGSIQFKNAIDEIKKICDNVKIEVLTPDFKGNKIALNRIIEAKPDVFNHNIETIERLYPSARQLANYNCTLDVLDYMKQHKFITKSGFMLGLGETKDEIKKLISDLNAVNLDILTIGQYLQPSKRHLQVEKYYTIDEYKAIEEYIKSTTNILPIVSPLARSSYKAFEAYNKIVNKTIY